MGTKPSGEDLRMRDDEACTGSHFFGFSDGLGEIVVRKLIEHEEDSELFSLIFYCQETP
jgi:hypothetical protein